MASVYSRRLAQFKGMTGSRSAVVPAGKTWVIKELDWVDMAGSAGTTIVVQMADGTQVFGQTAGAAYGSRQWTCFVVFNAGETLVIRAAAGSFDVTVSGYELTNA